MLNIVPRPGFCFRNIQKKRTVTLIKNVEAPIDKLEIFEIPSAKTDQGEFPVVDNISNPSPKPNIVNPKIKKKDVENLGFKLKLSLELQYTFGMFLIDKNILYCYFQTNLNI